MTSVGVISSAVARIECLRNLQKDPESLPVEADGLLNDLEEMKRLLATAYGEKIEAGAKLEKELVRISYDVVHTITDAFKPASIFDQLKKSSSSKLRELQVQLKPFKEELMEKVYPDQTAGPDRNPASPRLEKASPKHNHKEGHFRIPIRMNSGISFVGRKVEKFITGKVMNKKPESTAGSEVQGGDGVAGLDEKLESITGLETQGRDGVAGLDKIPESMSGSKMGEDKNRLLNRLKTDLMSKISKDDPQEVYIVAKSGMGKSTLAKELYNDHEIRNFFEVFGWVPINPNFQIKGVLQLLLQQLSPWQEEQQQLDLTEMNEIELISQIFDVVKDKSYLLVLDDIGTMQDWESIRLALPLANSTRVIITTSSNDFSSRPHHYKILGLTQSETLALLNNEASFDLEVGEVISKISGGSPLYATILAKSLKSEAYDKHLVKELVAYKSKKGTPHVLGACYKRLAPELKPCFLYLGQFPPCQDIQVDKLYLLLVAENLIMPLNHSNISPQTLRDYLEILADLKLVGAEEDLLSETGLYKTCRLHDQVREFCKLQGLEEEFVEIVDFESLKQVVGPYTRRLAIYMTKYRGDATFSFKENDTVKKILSLLIFDEFDSAEEISGWPSEMDDLSDFVHLRVLNFEGVNFQLRKLPKGMEKLLLLRFLSFRGCFLEELPSYLSSLKQLETLDLLVRDECNVIIPGNIFTAMKRMVHLFLPRIYQGKGKTTKLRLLGLGMMETLVNFDTEIFEVEDLCKLKKLKILSTVSKGQNAKEMDAVVDLLNERKEELEHSSMEVTSFDCYNRASISALKKLLQCRFVHSVNVEGQIEKLPAEGGGGERVAEMVLRGSELEIDPMGYFGKFQKLRSLVLANDAFMGTQILISTAPFFPNLRSLKLQNLQYLEKLTIEEGAMPLLSSLQIESCGFSLELTIPEKLYLRLKFEIGGDAYSVVPSPTPLNIT